MDIKELRCMLNNNELGQTISTIELLSNHGSCTIGLVELKSELELELKSRRKEEQREREYEQERLEVKEVMTGWVSRNTIANAIVGALSYPNQTMSVASAKNLWIRCLADINGFVEEHLIYPR